MKLSKKVIIGTIITIALFGSLVWYGISSKSRPGQYDDFAKCLSGKNVKMYGAFWCPHCSNQKKTFGNSWQYVTYIECSTSDGRAQTQICQDQNIESYPTWESGDGKRLTGELTMLELSRLSGCALSQ